MNNINEDVIHLATCRNNEKKAIYTFEAIQDELATSPLGQRLEEARVALTEAKETAGAARQVVVEAAKDVFSAVGDKQPHPSVKIKMFTVLHYDPDEALLYSTEHLPQALKLDKRAFDKAAKVLELDFVISAIEARPTIARDLSEYLPQ